jgi:putative phosphoesterase
MRILVFSDTHRNIENCLSACRNIMGVDIIIHLGDVKQDADKIEKITGIKTVSVVGNNEFCFERTEKTLKVCGKTIFITHGHTYGVKSDKTKIAEKTKKLGADIGLFGHTHVPFDGTVSGARLLNPGSAGRGARPSYGVIEIENGVLSACILYF